MPKPGFIKLENNLLVDLNEITDFVIGNEKPEDAGCGERNTYPEILAYAMMFPRDVKAVQAAIDKHGELLFMVNALGKKIGYLKNRIDIKKGKLSL